MAELNFTFFIKSQDKKVIIIKLQLLAKISDTIYFHTAVHFTNLK